MTVIPFAGIRPELETFLERAPMNQAPAALDRWKQLEENGWEVTALGAVDGSHLIGLGCRYLSATRGAEASVG